MRTSISRLLITLVLLTVVMVAAWTPAHARPREGTSWVHSYTRASVVIGAHPGMRPASGEPDSGAQKSPPPTIGISGPVNDTEDPTTDPPSSVMEWFSRIGMMWMTRYLGVS